MANFSRTGAPITLAVRIVYRDAKAATVRSSRWNNIKHDVLPIVRKDINTLGLSAQPKMENVTRSPGVDNAVDLFWPSAQVDSQLDTTLTWACEKLTREDLATRSIEMISLYHLPPESTVIDTYYSHCKFTLTSPSSQDNPHHPFPSHPISGSQSSSPTPSSGPFPPFFSRAPPRGPRNRHILDDQTMQSEQQQHFAFVSRQRDRLARDIKRLEEEAEASVEREKALRAQLVIFKMGGQGTGQDCTLRELREKLARAEDKERTVRRRLQAIDRSDPTVDIHDAMAAVEKRIADLRAQIDVETAGYKDAEARLQEENARFARTVEDVRREGREPFVVPELVEAFLSVSSMASQVAK